MAAPTPPAQTYTSGSATAALKLPILASGIGPASSPTAHNQWYNFLMYWMDLFVGNNSQGQVIDMDAGLSIGVYPCRYRIGGTAYDYAGGTDSVTDDDTRYVYLDATGLHEAAAWPGTEHFKLAVVVAASGDIESITDHRWENIGTVAAWYLTAAAGDVDLAGYDLEDIGFAAFGASSELTIAAGSITPTQAFHTVDTAADAGSDELDTIVADADMVGRIVILKAEHTDRTVVIKDATDNIALSDGDFSLDDTDKCIVLLQDSTTTWVELCRNRNTLATLTANLDADGYNVTDLGMLNFDAATELTLSGGAVTAVQSVHTIDTEADAASDYLDTISGGTAGDVIFIRPAHTDRTVIVTDAGNIILANDIDFTMDSSDHVMQLLFDGSNWREVSRSQWRLSDLIATGKCTLNSLVLHERGALSVATLPQRIRCDVAGVIRYVHGYVDTAPSGGACIIDVLDFGTDPTGAGSSIFSNQAEMINITDGNQYDTSAEKDHAVDAGDWLGLECEAANSAEDLTVTIDFYESANTAPA